MKPYKSLLYEKSKQVDSALDKNELTLLKFEIARIVEGIESPDAEDLYISGLSHYNAADKLQDINDARTLFSESLKKDRRYYIARLYLAHCYHDTKEFELALQQYLEVDREKLKNEFPLWRTVKLLEQIGFCLHILGRIDEARPYFEEVLEFYENKSLSDLANPLEIYQSLSESDPLYVRLKEIENDYFSNDA
jgi:tetratricopeptide (TPR) repeat protein